MHEYGLRIPGDYKDHWYTFALDKDGLEVRDTTYQFVSLDMAQTLDLLHFLLSHQQELEDIYARETGPST